MVSYPTIREFGRCLILAFFTLSLAGESLPVCGQERPARSINVTLVEVPVRVFKGHDFVPDLTKEDFEVFENGIPQEITGFEARSRTIDKGKGNLGREDPEIRKSRTFILIFNVYDYSEAIGKAVDYFFDNVFRIGDRLVTIIEDKSIENCPENAWAICIKDYLARYKALARTDIWKAFRNLEERAQSLVALLTGAGATDYPDDIGQAIGQYIAQYQQVWNDYRRRMFDVDLDFYRSVIRSLERTDNELWAICFQQRDLFPRVRSQSRLDRELGARLEGDTLIRSRFAELNRSFDISKTLPAEKISGLFAEANITFHLLIFKSGSLSSDVSQHLELQDVNSDYVDLLSRISRKTGGLTFSSNNVLDGLRLASAKEDRYYLLVYQPKEHAGDKERRIEVKVKQEGADVVAMKEFVGPEPPGITISDFVARNKTVSFKIGGCARPAAESGSFGRAAVRVTVYVNDTERVFDQSKTIDLKEKTVRLSLSFKNLPSGRAFIVIEAFDLVSRQKDILSSPIEL
jgi:hypothetical protein